MEACHFQNKMKTKILNQLAQSLQKSKNMTGLSIVALQLLYWICIRTNRSEKDNLIQHTQTEHTSCEIPVLEDEEYGSDENNVSMVTDALYGAFIVNKYSVQHLMCIISFNTLMTLRSR